MGCSQKINSEVRLPGRPGCVKKPEPRFAPAADPRGRGRVPRAWDPSWRATGKGSVLADPEWAGAKWRVGEMSVRGGGCNIARSSGK